MAIHDIGAATFYSDVKIIDLFGLAELDIAKKWQKSSGHDYQKDDIKKIAEDKGAYIHIGHVWSNPGWKRIGGWVMENSYFGNDTIIVTSLRRENDFVIKENLIEFEKQLPNDVKLILFNEE